MVLLSPFTLKAVGILCFDGFFKGSKPKVKIPKPLIASISRGEGNEL